MNMNMTIKRKQVPEKKIESKFNDVEEEILQRVPEVRLIGLLRKRNESLQEFLVKFFTKWNLEKDTVLVINKEHVDTPAGRRRSLGDIYRICKYYFPNCTIDEVLDLLYNVLPDEIEGFRSSYCSTILKRVWYYDPERPTDIYNTETEDEFGYTVSHYTE